MSQDCDDTRQAFAAILTDGLGDVIEELHGFDPVDLVSYIRFGRYAAIEDLLQSAAELFFKDGTLTFGWTAAVDMAWNEIPTVTLGMEFNHKAVSVFFDLSLRAMGRGVAVVSVLFDPDCPDPAGRIARLAEAVADACLPKRSGARPPLAHPRDGQPLISR